MNTPDDLDRQPTYDSPGDFDDPEMTGLTLGDLPVRTSDDLNSDSEPSD